MQTQTKGWYEAGIKGGWLKPENLMALTAEDQYVTAWLQDGTTMLLTKSVTSMLADLALWGLHQDWVRPHHGILVRREAVVEVRWNSLWNYREGRGENHHSLIVQYSPDKAPLRLPIARRRVPAVRRWLRGTGK